MPLALWHSHCLTETPEIETYETATVEADGSPFRTKGEGDDWHQAEGHRDTGSLLSGRIVFRAAAGRGGGDSSPEDQGGGSGGEEQAGFCQPQVRDQDRV